MPRPHHRGRTDANRNDAMTQLPLRSQFKFATVVLLTTVAVLMIALYFHVRASLLDEREERLHEQVEIAAGILDYYHAEEAAGRLDRASAQKQAATALSAMHHEDAYFFGYDRDGIYVVQGANKDLIGKPIKGLRDASGLDLYAALERAAAGSAKGIDNAGFVEYVWKRPGVEAPEPKLSYVKRFAPWGWVLGSGQYVADLDAQVASERWLMIGGFLVVALLMSGMMHRLSSGILRRIHTVLGFAQRVARRDLDAHLPAGVGDEIGQMTEALNAAVATLRSAFAEIEAAAQRDRQQMQRLQAAENTAARAERLALAVREVDESLQTVAGSTSELETAVHEISRNLHEAVSVVGTATRAVDAAAATVAQLTDSSARIGQVSRVINDIAEQTNLLALNATIEAARAGEAGKGFAVVASEVKDLARDTARATDDIGQRIGSIQADTNQVVDAIEQIRQTISEVNRIATMIASAVEEQSVTTREISRSVGRAAEGSAGITDEVKLMISTARG